MQNPTAVPVSNPNAVRNAKNLTPLLPAPTLQLGVLATPMPDGFTGQFDDDHYSRIQAVHEKQSCYNKEKDLGAVARYANEHPLVDTRLWDAETKSYVFVRAAYWRWNRGYYLTAIIERGPEKLDVAVVQTYSLYDEAVVAKAEESARRYLPENPELLLPHALTSRSA